MRLKYSAIIAAILVAVACAGAYAILPHISHLGATLKDVGPTLPSPPDSSAPTAPVVTKDEALIKECDYIANCSYTEATKNSADAHSGTAGYGALNDVRIGSKGPDYVRPGEGAMGAIGLMAGAAKLRADKVDVSRYDGVLNAFFRNWATSGGLQANNGGVYSQIGYGSDGAASGKPSPPTVAVTSEMMIALWKYYEYNKDDTWLKSASASELMQKGAAYLMSNFDGAYNLEKADNGTFWTNDSALAVPALLCAARWAKEAGTASTASESWAKTASLLQRGLEGMKDSKWHAFFRYRETDGTPTYGDSFDQTCFVPYETDALDPKNDPFVRSLSDVWTNGVPGSPAMTQHKSDPADWKYYGSHWQWSFKGNANNNHLYPGPGLQIAKVEWKYGHFSHDAVTVNRAKLRYQFAASAKYSNLWGGISGIPESNVANGIVDWRDATDPTKTAGSWERYVDTSAYFIEVTLMQYWNIDTNYTPSR